MVVARENGGAFVMRVMRYCAVGACTVLCAPGCVEAFALIGPAPHRTGPTGARELRAAGLSVAGAANPIARVRVPGALGLSSGRARTPASSHRGQLDGASPSASAWTPPEGYVPKDRRTKSAPAVPAEMAGEEGGRADRAPSWTPPVGYVPNSRRGWQGLANPIGAATLSDSTSLTERNSETPGAYAFGGQGALQGTDEDDVVPLPDTSCLSVRERLMLLEYILCQMPAERRQRSLAPREGVRSGLSMAATSAQRESNG